MRHFSDTVRGTATTTVAHSVLSRHVGQGAPMSPWAWNSPEPASPASSALPPSALTEHDAVSQNKLWTFGCSSFEVL